MCTACLDLQSNGVCGAAARGAMRSALKTYKPDPRMKHRCLGFKPKAGGPSGRDRWDWMFAPIRERQDAAMRALDKRGRK